MPTQLKKPSIQFAVLVTGIVVLIGFAFGISSAGLTSGGVAGATAELEVDGQTYQFSPSTCTVTDADFLAAGPGAIEGDSFWVTASSDGIDLAVGVETEAEAAADNQRLISVDEIRWSESDGVIAATTRLQDPQQPDAPTLAGRLSLTCTST